MKTILNTTLASIIASAYIMSFTGCVDDRAYFGGNDINVTGGTPKLDPKGDEDGDGLTNEEEDDIGTNPLDPDSDDDGLNDGLEVKVIGTNPLSSDSDSDGVSDGIEVVGTYLDNIDPAEDNGKVITAGENKIPLEDGEDGLKVLDVDAPISISDWGDKEAANIHKNIFTDPTDKIDALDPLNDSDYDKRPNNSEKTKGTDPLDQNSFYPWIYETPVGIVMEAAGFAYVPSIDDNGGFWMSQYEARPASTIPLDLVIDNFGTFINSHFNVLTGEPATGYETFTQSGIPLYIVNFNNATQSMVGAYGFEASYILDNSQITDGETISLPSLRQFEHALKLVNIENDNSVRNSTLAYDDNVEEDYSRSIFELQSGVKEFTKTLVRLAGFTKPTWWSGTANNGSGVYLPPEGEGAIVGSATGGQIGAAQPYALGIKGNNFTDLRFSISYGDNTANAAIGFRATSNYIVK